MIGEITPRTCREYVKWRMSHEWKRTRKAHKGKPPKMVSFQAPRRELSVLRAAIGYAVRNRDLKYIVPVEMPPQGEPRDRWLTRSEVARLLWATRVKRGMGRHIARFILVGLYTGTRHEAILKLRWAPSTMTGWVDLERGIIYRKGSEEGQSKKRRTPVPISDRLLAHMRRWKKNSTTHVIEFEGKPIKSTRYAWGQTRRRAGLGPEVVPHILRHTFATWAVQDGMPLGKVAAAMGTTEKVVDRTYGHHAPERLRDVVNAVSGRRG